MRVLVLWAIWVFDDHMLTLSHGHTWRPATACLRHGPVKLFIYTRGVDYQRRRGVVGIFPGETLSAQAPLVGADPRQIQGP